MGDCSICQPFRSLRVTSAVRLLANGLVVAAACAAPPNVPPGSAVAATRPTIAADRDQAVHLECDQSVQPEPEPLRRLSAREYRNTLSDLFAFDGALHAVPESVARELDQLPRDGEPLASFSLMDTRLSQRHADTYLAVAEGIGREIAGDAKKLRALAGDCAVAAEFSAVCFDRFLAAFGSRVFRRPLAKVELDRLRDVAKGAEPAQLTYRQAISSLLAAPEFLFHWEQDSADSADATDSSEDSARVARGSSEGLRELTPYELASRLSYHFWQTMPDAELFAAAESGALTSRAGYERELARLARHRRARSTWNRFFKEWLQLDGFGGFALDQAFNSFAGNIAANDELYADAVWEIEQLVGHYTFDTPGSYRDLLTSNLVLTRSPRVAELYQAEPWDGRSVPWHFREGERSGLLTRAALLISANHATNPFRRGAFVVRRLLCESIEPPAQRPPEALAVPAFDADSATRARYENKVAPWECRGCHNFFSPYGYVLERYDALGRYRNEERLLDDLGEYHGKLPVDVKSRVRIDSVARDIDGPVALSQALSESHQATECFARQYFRFTFRRLETKADHCTLNAMLESLAHRGLAAFHREVALTSAFQHKREAVE